MDLPWPTFALTSITGSFTLVHFASHYSIWGSYIWTFLTLFLVQATIGAIYNTILWPKFLSPLRDLPGPPPGSFFNGQFKQIVAEATGVPQSRWMNSIPNDGMLYYTTALNAERILLTSTQGFNEVLTTKSYEFVKPSMLRNGLGRILGVGILLAEGDEHKRQRKMLMPAFAYRHIKDLYPVFWRKSCDLVQALMEVTQREGKESSGSLADAPIIEVSGWGSRVALDIIGIAGMGQDFGAIGDPDTELNKTYRKVFAPSKGQQIMAFAGLFLPQWFLRSLPVAHNNNVMEASETIKKICRQLIRQKQEKMDSNEKRTEVDILSVAIESGGFGEEDLVNQMMTFLVAGHETTATSLSWAFYALCLNPEIQTRLREEVRTHLPSADDSSTTVTAASLDSCTLLHAVCNEVLRLYAPVPITLRQATCKTSILGHVVPKGTTVLMPIWGANKSTKFWGPDAAEFKPDRWMGPGRANTGGAESNYAMLTFLHGPRSCIGQHFAKSEFACLLASVVGRFEFQLEDPDFPEKMVLKGSITAKPKGGMNVRMRPVAGW